MKLRSRLVATIAGLSLATLGGSFSAVYVVNNATQQRQLDEALSHEASEEAREIAQAGGERLMISARPGPAANDVGPLTKYAVIYGPRGRIIDATASFSGAPPALSTLAARRGAPPFNLWHGGEHLRAVLVPIPAAPLSTLLLAAPRSDLDGDAAFLGRAMLIVFGFAFAWVLLISLWVVRRFTRGHEAIARVARQVTHGDLSARVAPEERDEEVRQLAHDVNLMIARLSALLSAQQLFVAHAAHELRSPLTALYGELSHAVRKARDAETYRKAIEEALDSTRRLMVLAEDLLALARLSDGGEEPPESVGLREVVESALKWLQNEADGRRVRVQVQGADGLVVGRRLDLERLFRNLLENAIRHALPDSTVEVTLTGGEQLSAQIRNRGQAIPEHERERIFEPFARGEGASVRELPGTGLGLAIARQIALAHAGTLELSASTAAATSFLVRLPKAS